LFELRELAEVTAGLDNREAAGDVPLQALSVDAAPLGPVTL
jgi:hypothetical protein